MSWANRKSGSLPWQNRKHPPRRDLLTSGAKAAGVTCLAGLALTAYVESARKAEAKALRPPGALPEDEFQAACVHCGLCVRACPFDTLRLATMGEEAPLGTPFFVAREVPCFMCTDVPCAQSLPDRRARPRHPEHPAG